MTLRRALRGLALLLAGLLAGFFLYEAYALWRAHQRTPAVLKRSAEGELQLSDVSPTRQAMLLAVEDPGFHRHRGFDMSTPGQGRTNMTQSLVKIFYFDEFRPGFAKIEQSLIARFVLDPSLSKEGQLRAFLNHARFGRVNRQAVTGFAQAARAFYGREFGDLDDRQFLSLVAMQIAPKEFDPLRAPQANSERVRRIERLLAGRCKPTGVNDVRYEACA